MKISFINQPYRTLGKQVGDWLNEKLKDEQFNELRIASAWVKESGLSKLRQGLEQFRNRAVISSIIVGIDEGGATRQGLELALELFKQVHVLYEPNGGTFHPKVYLVSNTNYAELVVGSSNLTAGGLYSNREASLLCELDLAKTEDKTLFDQVIQWFETLYSDNNTCKALDQELLTTLLSDSRYKIGDETQKPREVINKNEEDHSEDSILTEPVPNIFSRSGLPKKTIPQKQSSKKSDGRISRSAPATTTSDSSIASAPLANNQRVIYKWKKQLNKTDAQKSNPGSNSTGNLRLAKANNDIEHRTFFKDKMFGDQFWSSDENGLEKTTVNFEVIIDGSNLGLVPIDISYKNERDAGQGNVTTVLHWGNTLSPILRADDNNYTDYWVMLERFENGSFRLEITKDEPLND